MGPGGRRRPAGRPSYEPDGDARYPVVYLLHAFGAGPEAWLGGDGSYAGLDVPAVLDSLISAGSVSPMIVVMPDARTRLGGSWYADSPVAGRWETFLARDVVGAVDRRFRTMRARGARGLAGQSMGAYGALRIGMRHPDVFGSALAVSPVLVEDPNPLGELGARAALEADPTDLADASVPARVLWSRAAAFSPDPERPPAFGRLPFRARHGSAAVVESVWRRWEENTLARLARSNEAGLRRLRLRIEVGEQDALREEVERWSDALAAEGIEHEPVVFPGGHVAGVRERFTAAVFQFFSTAFGEGGGSVEGGGR